ncbi:MAG TPA: hypothetical protein VMV81_13990 [Phycisphaerae bacterium]|nr:hypothetical protein [Phycisphaerae bacterium]
MQAIRLKCKCGKILRVSTDLAGRKVACPACKTTYRVPTAEPVGTTKTLAESPARVNAPSAPALDRSDMDLTAAAVAATPSELDLLSEIELIPSGATCPRCKKQQPGGAKICVTCGIVLATGERIGVQQSGAPQAVGYAQDRFKIRRSTRDPVGEPVRGYWADSMHSFVYPLKSLSNVVTLGVIIAIASCRVFLIFGIFALIGKFIIGGWLAACYLSVVTHTAMGIEALPGIKMEDGPWDDIIKPAFRYAGAIFFALAPAAAFVILLASGVLPEFMQSGVALLLWFAGGIFIWPMLVMLFAFEEWKQAYRIDLIITTISRAFLPYLSLWLILLLVGSTSILPYLFPVFDKLGIDLHPEILGGDGVLASILVQAVGVYLTIVSMRQIGLYYLHFKNRFTFSFE